MHAALRVAARHLLMHDAAARRHPLHVARAEHALVAEAVAVIDLAGQHISDRLDAAMRMPGKAGLVLVGIVVAEIVQQQERIELLGVAEAEGAAQMHAGAFHGRLGLDDLLHGTDGHDTSPFVDRECLIAMLRRRCVPVLANARLDQRGELTRRELVEEVFDAVLSSVTVPSSSIRPRLEGGYRSRRRISRTPCAPRIWRRCCCASAVPIAPGEVPVTAASLAGPEFLPHGRAPQSMAFFSTAGIERLCSGVTKTSRRPPRSRT